MPVCDTSCQGDFVHFFVVFVPYSRTFAPDPRVVESVTGLFLVEHPHTEYIQCFIVNYECRAVTKQLYKDEIE